MEKELEKQRKGERQLKTGLPGPASEHSEQRHRQFPVGVFCYCWLIFDFGRRYYRVITNLFY